jgi:hypothetical protein
MTGERQEGKKGGGMDRFSMLPTKAGDCGNGMEMPP